MANWLRTSAVLFLGTLMVVGLVTAGCDGSSGGGSSTAKSPAGYKARFASGDSGAIKDLAKLPTEKAVSILETLLTDDDPQVAGMAAMTIKKLEPSGQEAVLGELMVAFKKHPKSPIFAQTVVGRKAMAVPYLITLLEDPDPKVRGLAAEQLGKLWKYGRPAIQPLMVLLEDEDSKVQLKAIGALGFMRTEGEPALPALRAIAADEAHPHKKWADGSVKRIEHLLKMKARREAEGD